MNKIKSITCVVAATLFAGLICTSPGIAQESPDFKGLTLVQIYKNENLKNIAVARGETVFKQHCAECHGEEGTGSTGVSDLTNNLWLWGGSLSDLEITIRYGIRSGHELQRFSEMPAYGGTDLLTNAQIDDLVEYVLSISYQEADQAAVQRAAGDWEKICTECHNDHGTGRMEYYGAPDLTDYYWQYGESREAIRASITAGRAGVSPAYDGKLDDETIKMLTVYVHYLTHF